MKAQTPSTLVSSSFTLGIFAALVISLPPLGAIATSVMLHGVCIPAGKPRARAQVSLCSSETRPEGTTITETIDSLLWPCYKANRSAGGCVSAENTGPPAKKAGVLNNRSDPGELVK